MRKTKEEIIQAYRERLILPEFPKEEIKFSTKNGLEVANYYERVVIGDRGPYIEFSKSMMIRGSMYVPKEQKWRIYSDKCYYIELRTNIDFVKIYLQKKEVDYADYKIRCLYISPFDLTSNIYHELIRSK